MGENRIRLLRADEIECRVSMINGNGLGLLLFKDARVDQRILDEAFTPFGWRRTHQSIDGNLYCTVEIWDGEKKQWVAKQDVGVSGHSEKEKGQASDSFKRACFNWGVGRELYTAPFIWIPPAKADIQLKGERYITKDSFRVHAISYNGQREISALTIVNQKGAAVYVYERKNPAADTGETLQGGLTGRQMAVLEKELERTGIPMETVLERYHLYRAEQMTPEIYKKALGSLKKTRPKEAA